MSMKNPADDGPKNKRHAADEAWRDWYSGGKAQGEPGGGAFPIVVLSTSA